MCPGCLKKQRKARKISVVNVIYPLGKLNPSIQENRWSNVDIANRAIERCHNSGKESIGEYKNKPAVSVTARHMNRAAILGVAMLRTAAGGMGIRGSKAGEYELMNVRTTTELTERDKRLVMSFGDGIGPDDLPKDS